MFLCHLYITLADLTTLKDRFTRKIRLASRMNPAETRTDLIILLRTVWDEIMLPIVNILVLYVCSYEVCHCVLCRNRTRPTGCKERQGILGYRHDAATRAGALQAVEENACVHLA
ncbi:hypothetical protein CY34DRAFT_565559 [Suillus luteus UH-Slu-Lm8-n1]|uniref:Uncharacterized protein n=1 Tax=Suillus luteus UH-Slu-Lm8-n1 TaxID=930992 RepID=A0A0D0AC05_9AGAM|nr:hypothetical protein CY34DRAFT_565559 [Suillus luteus UH-Slu-Lm8-n1]